MFGPLGAELVGTSQGAVTTADNKRVDAVANEVESSGAAALNLAESGAASGSNQGSSDRGKSSDVVPANLRIHASISPYYSSPPAPKRDVRG